MCSHVSDVFAPVLIRSGAPGDYKACNTVWHTHTHTHRRSMPLACVLRQQPSVQEVCDCTRLSVLTDVCGEHLLVCLETAVETAAPSASRAHQPIVQLQLQHGTPAAAASSLDIQGSLRLQDNLGQLYSHQHKVCAKPLPPHIHTRGCVQNPARPSASKRICGRPCTTARHTGQTCNHQA